MSEKLKLKKIKKIIRKTMVFRSRCNEAADHDMSNANADV